MNTEATILCQEVHKIFSDVQCPADSEFAEDWPNELSATVVRLQKVSYQDLQSKDFDSQGGLIEGVQSLSAQAFVYLLPGLVRIALMEPVNRYCIVTGLMTFLTRGDNECVVSPSRQEKVLSKLSFKQREFLTRFFRYFINLEPTFCVVILDSAIENLRQGSVTPYRQEEVSRWANRANGMG